MKILVTGGLGYIGSHTITSLAVDHEIVILDNNCNSSPNVLRRLEDITGKIFVVEKVDVHN
jgi:UDP-glucose 4-epimerase